MSTKAAPTAQWTEPAAAGVAQPASHAVVILDEDGDWAVTDERGVMPDGYIVIDGDDPAVDPDAESGLRLVQTAGIAVAYG